MIIKNNIVKLHIIDMELWTFVNKVTGDVIRFNKEETGDSEFGIIYYLSDFELYPTWFTSKRESIDFLLSNKKSNKSIHPLYSQLPETPDFGKIDLDNYEVKNISV